MFCFLSEGELYGHLGRACYTSSNNHNVKIILDRNELIILETLKIV